MKQFFKASVLFALTIFCGSSTFAQVFLQQDFVKPDSIPTGWTTLSPNGSGWKVSNDSVYSHDTYFIPTGNRNIAAVCDELCSCSNDNDILKTQPLNFKGASSVYLSFQSYFSAYYLTSNPGIAETAEIVVSPDGGTTWTSSIKVPADSTGTWETMYYDISSFAGDSDVVVGFLYSDSSHVIVGWGVDSVSIFVPNGIDLSINSPTPVTSPTPGVGAYNNYFVTGSTCAIGFSVFNNSDSSVTSFSATYTVDGGSPVTQTFSGFTLPAFGNLYNLSFTTPYNVTSLDAHKVQIVVNINGDANPGNDTANTTVIGVAFMPYHNMVFEEATGAWCGWCPRGIVYMDSIKKAYPGNPNIINVHDDLEGPDPMAISVYDDGEVGTEQFFLNGRTYFPDVLIDRKELLDPGYAFYGYAFHINDFGFANMSATQTFDASTRISTVDVTANFAVDMSDVIRLACVYTEDSVNSTSSAYNQNDYYSFLYANSPLSGAGFNWQDEASPIPGAEMYFSDVARTIVGGYLGQPSSLPATIKANGTYTHSFSYTIPADYNENNMKMIVLLIDASKNVILNSTTAQSVTGINDVKSSVQMLSLYPNPVNSELNVLFSLSKPQSIVIEITDMLGRVVYTAPYNNLAPTSQMMQIPVNNLSSGIYLFNIKTNTGIVSRKFVKD